MLLKDNALNLNYDLTETDSYKTMPHYNYWRGWWNEEARNPVESVIQLLWEEYINPNDYPHGGFEYWSRVLTPGGFLEWHQDTGEYNYFNENYWISEKSLLYYPKVSNDCIGGFLEIAPYKTRSTLDKSQEAARCVDNNDIERIRAVQNRMVLFDSAQLHRISNVYKGERYNLATALWKETPDFFAECENWSVGGQGEKLQLDLRKVEWKDKYTPYDRRRN